MARKHLLSQCEEKDENAWATTISRYMLPQGERTRPESTYYQRVKRRDEKRMYTGFND